MMGAHLQSALQTPRAADQDREREAETQRWKSRRAHPLDGTGHFGRHHPSAVGPSHGAPLADFTRRRARIRSAVACTSRPTEPWKCPSWRRPIRAVRLVPQSAHMSRAKRPRGRRSVHKRASRARAVRPRRKVDARSRRRRSPPTAAIMGVFTIPRTREAADGSPHGALAPRHGPRRDLGHAMAMNAHANRNG